MNALMGEDQQNNHRVENQPEAWSPRDLWKSDGVLRDYAKSFGADGRNLARAGGKYGSEDLAYAAEEARRDAPRLKLFDAQGRRLDEVAFNPNYHLVMKTAMSLGYHNCAWTKAKGGHATHAAHVYFLSQVEPGVCCPLTMTYASVAALTAAPEIENIWRPQLLSGTYDASVAPIGEKSGATLGMAMTEKQGGSDVRSNSTVALRDGDRYLLNGHKWFCSAPMSDGFLTLAQAPDGLTCFLVPRWLEGRRNGIHLQRLKDKMGNHANASAEIEYHNAEAYRIGDEGDGVRRIIEMVHHTRLDTAMAPAGLMRGALVRAFHWVSHRKAFQKTLIDQPLMRSVIADLVLDMEGALALGLRASAAFDGQDDKARSLARVAVALAKFYNNKRCGHVVSECLEIFGGMGYVEESGLPMFYREAPLNGIWEGSGNVICLDILRTLQQDPLAVEALDHALDAAISQNSHYDAALAIHRIRWSKIPALSEARWFVENLAKLLTTATLIEHAPSAIADSFVASRLTEQRGTIAGAAALLNTDQAIKRLIF